LFDARIYLCGSHAMGAAVEEKLEQILGTLVLDSLKKRWKVS
jgi:sulfite reductase alpha subunit-like flavoprotein